MAKSQQRHTQLKRRAAGPTGHTEKRQGGGIRLDASRGRAATEVERSGRIRPALARLRKEASARKKLIVPQKDMDRAAETAREMGIKVTVENLGGTKQRRVNP